MHYLLIELSQAVSDANNRRIHASHMIGSFCEKTTSGFSSHVPMILKDLLKRLDTELDVVKAAHAALVQLGKAISAERTC